MVLVLSATFLGSCKQATKKRWISEMQKKLPKEFCKNGSVFLECFKVTKEECIRTAGETTKVCLARFEPEIPSVLKQPEDGRHWGQKVGGCAGKEYEVRLTRRSQMTEGCKKALRAIGIAVK